MLRNIAPDSLHSPLSLHVRQLRHARAAQSQLSSALSRKQQASCTPLNTTRGRDHASPLTTRGMSSAHVGPPGAGQRHRQWPREISTHDDLIAFVESFDEAHLFIGYGYIFQFADVEEVLSDLKPHLSAIQQRCGEKPWLAVFGGDQAVADEPDVGRLMQLVRQRYDGCRLLAVSFQSVDSHVDHFYRPDIQYKTVTDVDPATGQASKRQEPVYGGVRDGDGELLGNTRVYLGPDFVAAADAATAAAGSGDSGGSRRRPLLTGVVAAGGGGVALQEIRHVARLGLPLTYVASRARNVRAGGSEFGPVHQWWLTTRSN